MTDAIDTDALRARYAKASVPAPWFACGTDRPGVWGLHGEPVDAGGGKQAAAYIADVFGGGNAEAIAALYNAAPAMLDEIDRLRVEVKRKNEALRRLMRTGAMSANIMRDPRRTDGWEGAERTADAFDRMAEHARAALTP